MLTETRSPNPETKTKVERLISEGKEKVSSGTKVAQECAGVLEQIVADVSKVSQMAGEISTANREQAQGVSELNKAMGQLDQATGSSNEVCSGRRKHSRSYAPWV